jgi:hypothetical protein
VEFLGAQGQGFTSLDPRSSEKIRPDNVAARVCTGPGGVDASVAAGKSGGLLFAWRGKVSCGEGGAAVASTLCLASVHRAHGSSTVTGVAIAPGSPPLLCSSGRLQTVRASSQWV